jgi:hypothetical protein
MVVDFHISAGNGDGSLKMSMTGDFRHFGKFMNRPELTFSMVVQTVAEFLATLQSG